MSDHSDHDTTTPIPQIPTPDLIEGYVVQEQDILRNRNFQALLRRQQAQEDEENKNSDSDRQSEGTSERVSNVDLSVSNSPAFIHRQPTPTTDVSDQSTPTISTDSSESYTDHLNPNLLLRKAKVPATMALPGQQPAVQAPQVLAWHVYPADLFEVDGPIYQLPPIPQMSKNLNTKTVDKLTLEFKLLKEEYAKYEDLTSSIQLAELVTTAAVRLSLIHI